MTSVKQASRGVTAEAQALDKLHLAIESNDIKAVRAYINQHPNSKSNDINTRYKLKSVLTAPVLVAIQKGYVEMVKILIDTGAVIEENLGFSPFLRARKIQDLKIRWQMIQLLRKAGVRVSNGDHQFVTKSLHEAVTKGSFEMVKMILDTGADVNCTRVSKFTPLQSAMMELKANSRIEMVKQLIKAGADVNLCLRGATCLYMAIKDKDYSWKLVEILLNEGAVVNHVDKLRRSPLSIAAANNRYDLVKQMIDAGANVNIAQCCTNSPLHQASVNHHKNIVKLLLECGADVNARDDDGKTIVYCAAKNCQKRKMSEYIDILKMLLNSGPVMNHLTGDRYPAFQFVLKYANLEIMNLFFQRGLQLRNCGVRFPLHHAAVNDKEEVLEYLLKKQFFDVDELDNFGNTALFEAVRHRREPCIRLLIKWGADPNICNGDASLYRRHTSLRQAVTMTKPNILDLLLSAGASMHKNAQQFKSFLNLASTLAIINHQTMNHIIGDLALLRDQNRNIDRDFENTLMTEIPRYLRIVGSCSTELQDMKSTVLYGSLTFYDFLCTRDVSRYVKNKAVSDTFASVNFDERFPIYGIRLRESYSLALVRREVMDEAKQGLSKLLRFHLSGCDEIFYSIMAHLRMKDLRNLCIIRKMS